MSKRQWSKEEEDREMEELRETLKDRVVKTREERLSYVEDMHWEQEDRMEKLNTALARHKRDLSRHSVSNTRLAPFSTFSSMSASKPKTSFGL